MLFRSVGAADSAGKDAEEDVAGEDGGCGDVFNAEEAAGSGEVGMEDGGSHGVRLMRRRRERQMGWGPTHDDEAVMKWGTRQGKRFARSANAHSSR